LVSPSGFSEETLLFLTQAKNCAVEVSKAVVYPLTRPVSWTYQLARATILPTDNPADDLKKVHHSATKGLNHAEKLGITPAPMRLPTIEADNQPKQEEN